MNNLFIYEGGMDLIYSIVKIQLSAEVGFSVSVSHFGKMPGCFFIACYNQIISLLPISLSLPLLFITSVILMNT